MSADLQSRITALHDWYCRNVMPVRLTPEVERLWLEWLKAGYCGPDLRAVILYLRRQIAIGKRNEGSLKLTNLIQRSEAGFIGFDMDLGLARARTNLNPMKKLEPAPDQNNPVGRDSVEPSKTPSPPQEERAGERRPNLEALKKLRDAAS